MATLSPSQRQLLLYALISIIPALFRNPLSPIPGVPGVFPSFQDAKGEGHSLTFLQRLDNNLLLFKALDDMSWELCVKTVYGPYGEEAHQMLSRENMASDFLGVSRIEDGPTTIVIEMLDESWETLYDFAQRNPRWTTDGVQPTTHKRLGMILMKLGRRICPRRLPCEQYYGQAGKGIGSPG